MKLYKVVLLSVFAISTACGKKGGEKPAPENPEKPAATGLLYQWDFEGNIPIHDFNEITPNVSVVADPLDPANRVMLCVLPVGEYRTEVCAGASKIHYFYADSTNVEHGDEFWVGVRILKMLEYYSGTNAYPSIFQIGPVQNPVTYPQETSFGHYQLHLNTKTDKWRLREFKSVYDPNEYADDIAPLNYGRWEKFVFHCIFRSNDTGLLEIWKNGVKVYSQKRQNGIKYDRTRIKWGVYIGAGNSVNSDVKCYFDDIKIGGANSSYDEVTP